MKTMGKSNINLTKTCTSCGLQKPLSAFLQLSGNSGTTYGNICNVCRKTAVEQEALKEPDGGTTSTTGVKIDIKSKVKGEKDRKQYWKDIEDRYEEAEKKQEEKSTQQMQKQEQVVRDEKSNREAKASTFREANEKAKRVSEQTVFGGVQHTTKEGQIDLATGPVQDTYIAGKQKYGAGSIWNQFKFLLPKTAAVAAKLVPPGSGGSKPTATPPGGGGSKPEKSTPPGSDQSSENPALDHAKKTWGPGAKKS